MTEQDPSHAIPASGARELSVHEVENGSGREEINSGCTINTNCSTACITPKPA
ncbi:MAG TPA: hypothetical protein VGB15_09655 [Longimicrobium sp.]|jgi:hypothetical protein